MTAFGDMAAEHASASDHQALYRRLMACAARDDPNADYVAQMLASWMRGIGSLPILMGLEENAFAAMLHTLFPHRHDDATLAEINCPQALRVEPERGPELEDVKALLLDHRAGNGDVELWIAQIVATGCMGSDHLWSDLGLFERRHLTAMLAHNFPTLAEQNNQNMRWKKFFYRSLCAKEGFFLCRSPSCETCSEYKVCFVEDGVFSS